jgi:hypothetical protein
LERSGAEHDEVAHLSAQHDALHAALAEAQEREATLQVELDGLRSAAAASPSAGLVIDDELLAVLGDSGEDRTLLAPEVRRERLVVMAVIFIAVLAGVALVTSGLTDVLW